MYVCLIFNVKRKKEHHPAPQSQESPVDSPSTSRKPIWLPTVLQLLFLNF